SGEGDRNDVVAGCPPEILHHLPVAGAREIDDARHIARIAPHEHDVSRLDGNVGPSADGHAYVSGDKRRGVVYTIAHHRYAFARPLQFLDIGRLVLRQHLSEYGINAEVTRDRLRHSARIASHHHHLDTRVVQPPHRFR